ncbi:hypothetical protein Jiend_51540 [Micromonospora endophytica]|nr:hypothetical protein Jiend_51540 [Micromonospora endophytica]
MIRQVMWVMASGSAVAPIAAGEPTTTGVQARIRSRFTDTGTQGPGKVVTVSDLWGLE